jgi:pimeloyl-ACP methyl ester carboxylesterase
MRSREAARDRIGARPRVTQIEPRRLSTSGGEIAYTVIGQGPDVLLIHGFPLNALTWRAIAPMLAPRFRVIVPDLLGAGKSEQRDGARLDAAAQADRVRELLMHLAVTSYAVVAHGTGGLVAQTLALGGTGVEAMVLLDSPMIGAPMSSMAEVVTRSDGPRATVRALFEAGGRKTGRITEDIVEANARPFLGDPEALRRAASILTATGVDERDTLAGIDYPVLLLWGEEDPFVPVSVAERLNEAIPSSTLGLLPGCGHFLVEEASDTIAPLISEYLRAMYLKAPHGHPEEKAGVVMLQLERRPPWVDLAEDEADDWFVDDADDEGDVP